MAGRVSVNVSLSPELERFIADRVASGRYQSVSEVVREGLRLLEERELVRQVALDDLRAKIAVGLDQIKRGKVHDGKAVFESIQTGITGELMVEVVSGPRPGEEIVTGPFKALREIKDGDRVKKMSEKEKKAAEGQGAGTS